ncbi:MAG TPA: hypothetical protein VKZ79_03145 [Alphaproteobacteria bacterium]|nr:hypothetical protein [Alphaproteobacteria bacterium]
MTGPKSTEAEFIPEKHWGLAKLNAVEIMAVVVGVALCSIGKIGMVFGIPIALGALYSGLFVQPKYKRGIYSGRCPHCSALMSAMHYQEKVDCPSCGGSVKVENSRFVAQGAEPGKAA